MSRSRFPATDVSHMTQPELDKFYEHLNNLLTAISLDLQRLFSVITQMLG